VQFIVIPNNMIVIVRHIYFHVYNVTGFLKIVGRTFRALIEIKDVYKGGFESHISLMIFLKYITT